MGILGILVLVILLLLPLFYFSRRSKEYRRVVKAVEQYKGSPWYPVIGTTWPQLTSSREDLFQLMYDREAQYGPIYRSWVGSRPLIHLTKAKHAEIILRGSKHLTKGPSYRFVRPWLGDGLITGNGPQWQRHRKLLTPTFHFKILDNFQEVFSVKAQQLVEQLEPLADGKFFDLYNYVTHCSLDIICETAMGVEINAMKSTESDYIKGLYRIAETVVYRWFRPWFHIDFLFQHSKIGKEQQHILNIIHGFADKVIEDRKKKLHNSQDHLEISEEDKMLGKKKRLVFLDLLLQHNELTDKEIREEVDTFIFAGHDTSTAATCWTLFSIGNYPEVQELVHQEIDSIFHGDDRPITPDDVARLQYTERVIKESLRIHSIVPFILRRLTEDLELEGNTIPAGVGVSIHIANLHMDPEQFAEPSRFDPDRFLPENVSKRNPYSYIPFSAGPRNCLGQKFAMRNIKTMVATLLRKYRVKSLKKPSEIRYYGDLVLKPQDGIYLSFQPRTV